MPRAAHVYFEERGSGFPLILGYPLTASPMPEDPQQRVLRGYLRGLVDLYRVVIMDYPNLGKSEVQPANMLTVEQVCADVLTVADAAGFARFIWWGYSWGGLVGLQLAGRTDRLAALVCGGWPPLGDLQSLVLQSCRATVQTMSHQRQYVTFYESMLDWQERRAVERIRCPRMTYAGSADEVQRGGVNMPTMATLRRHRNQLEDWGWDVREIPGYDHSLWMDPEPVLTVVRPFLDRVVAGEGSEA